MGLAVEAFGLTKRFGNFTAVDHVDLSIEEGEIFGLLGPNGAGKSTLVRMLTTLMRPTEGTAKVGGYDILKEPDEVRKAIGLVAEKLILYPRLNAVENLMFFGRLYGMEGEGLRRKVDELIGMVKLEGFKDFPIGGYSSGMRQRLNVVRALLHDPKILFLDEPTAMLDPQSIRFVRDLIKDLRKGGRTIILTTHIMEEAEELSDRVGIIDHGRILVVDTPEGLKSKLGVSNLLEVFLGLTGRDLRDRAENRIPIRAVGRV
ncbi:MAG: ABC transporter ATP-binding protein [Candidatus Bathyarchaeia archaeon]